MESVIIDPRAAYSIADGFAQASARILEFRVNHRHELTDQATRELERCEDGLDSLVVLFRNYGIRLIGQGAKEAADALTGAIEEARDALENIADVKKAIDLAAAVAHLAGALYMGNVKAIVGAVSSMAKATGKVLDANA